MTDWTINDARRVYNVTHWGGGYFDINAQGNLEARPRRETSSAAIDLYKLAQDINRTEMTWPILVRFTDILHDRVDTLHDAFTKAIGAESYQGKYQVVYPIKSTSNAAWSSRSSRTARAGSGWRRAANPS